MKTIGIAAIIALCTATGASAQERERTLKMLDRALARIESGAEVSAQEGEQPAEPSSEIVSLLHELERRDAVQQSAFALAAAKKLPAKAMERLERTRQAYAEGHGALLELVRAVAAPPVTGRAGRPAVMAPAQHAQRAREILERIRQAARNEPLSAGELKVRAPELQAPALAAPGVGQSAAVAGVDEMPIGSIPKPLRDAAAQMGGPIAAYEFVRNSVRLEFYYGEMKGALQTYLEHSGNDADTAAVLIALLRAQGIPARFVRGTVEVPAPALAAMVGTTSAEQAVRVLERAGIPHETLLGAGGVGAVKLERVWVEAYLPYANYRGAVRDARGKVWVSLDPGFKAQTPATGRDVGALGFDPRTALDDYLAGPPTATPLERARQRVAGLAAQSGITYAEVLNQQSVVAESLGLLPGSLPYEVLNVAEVGYELPDPLRHKLRLVGELDGTPVLEAVFPASDLLGRRLTLSYVPASEEDEEVVRVYGGLYWTPPFLIEVLPVVKSGGVVVARGAVPVGMGVKYTLRMEVQTPSGTQVISNRILAGNLLAIGVGGRTVTGHEAGSDHAAEILSARAWGYLERWNRSDEELAELFRVVPVRPTLSACLVMSELEVEYAGGDPLYPLSVTWKGIAIDADLRASAPVGIEGRESERAFLLISGLEGSVLENRIFEDDLGIASVSTAKALQLAREQGIEVVDVTSANVDDVLPRLDLDEAVKAEIREAVARGLLARVPVREVHYLAWHGVGYLLLDEETGEAAYQLQGGHSGGVTAPAVVNIPSSVLDPLLQQSEKPAPEGAEVAKIVKHPSTDLQEGIVNKRLSDPLRAVVVDENGQRVPKAQVTFTVMGGGATLIDPASGRESASEIVVLSNERGEAEVSVLLGKSTALIPRYVDLSFAKGAQVGLNLVTARAGAASLPEPFTAIAVPDYRFDGERVHAELSSTFKVSRNITNLRYGGHMQVKAEDPYANPLAGVPIHFKYRPDPEPGQPPPGWMRIRPPTKTPGKLLKGKDIEACIRTDPDPKWSQCAGEAEALAVETASLGTVTVFMILGDSPYSEYVYHAGTKEEPDLFKAAYGTWGSYCTPAPTCVKDHQHPDDPLVHQSTRLQLTNRRGDMIEAYPVGGQAKVELTASALYEKERVVKRVDPDGTIHYDAVGANEWELKPLTDSEFELKPKTDGTRITPDRPSADGNGTYRTTMTMAQAPQLNTITYDSKHYPLQVRYKDDRPPELDPAYVNPATLKVTRVADRARPHRGLPGEFGLWGVKLDIYEINRTPTIFSPVVLLGEDSATAYEFQIRHTIEPSQYASLLTPAEARLDFKLGNELVLTGNGNDPSQPFTIPRGLPMKAGVYTAQLRVLGVSGSPSGFTDIVSEPRTVTAGVVKLRLDANNDTVIDAKDDEKLKRNPAATFAFWEADPKAKDVDKLQDYATVRIHMPFLLPEGQRLALQLLGSNWVLKRKIDALNSCQGNSQSHGKAYLCHKGTAERQLNQLDQQDQPVKRGADQYEITKDMLRAGDNEFLFQCQPNDNGTPACPADGMILSHLIAYAPSIDLSVTSRRVDIRPFRDVVGVHSVRQVGTYDPAPFVRLSPGWKKMPGDASSVTVLVHGFDVSEKDSIESFLPMLAKRLYWAGTPVLEAQNKAYLTVLLWPGDQQGHLLPTARAFYPENEFNALRSGIPVSLWIDEMADGSQDRRVNVIAHSLGNMVVNNALKELSGSLRSPLTYVMLEAAVAAEAFYDAAAPVVPALVDHAQAYGYPDDARWRYGWSRMNEDQVCPPCFLRDWQRRVAAIGSNVIPPVKYEERWSRPHAGDRTAWPGFFSGNKDLYNVVIYNAYSPTDYVLRTDLGRGTVFNPHAWFTCQRHQKPNTSLFDTLEDYNGRTPDGWRDGAGVQFWAHLGSTSRAEELAHNEYLWPSGNHAGLIRQWLELAFWFSGVSGAAGAQPLASFGGDRNINMAAYSGSGYEGGDSRENSHSYFWVKTPADVWPVYEKLSEMLPH